MDTQQNYQTLLNNQRQFFATGATYALDFRLEQLKQLKSIVQHHEAAIYTALQKDLKKSTMESYISEILIFMDELDFIIKNLPKWMKPKSVKNPFPLLWPGKSQIYFEPYGSVLIFSAWNYPFLLTMSPLIGAMCAGNCVVVKPSETASQTQKLIVNLLNQHFPPEYIVGVKAGVEEAKQLLQEKFDYIFYVGGSSVGKLVMTAAAQHLTPITLELGGKSPCIIDESANLDFAARRIVWSKFMNAGQTCIAPDYLYVHSACKEKLITKLETAIQEFYGKDIKQSESYGKIINKKHFDRLIELMKKGKILSGGEQQVEELFIAPTLLGDINWQDPIMREEIFGPLLPLLTFDNMDDLITTLKTQPKSLALYLFTKNKQQQQKILSELSFGGGCINDCIMHISNPNLPFGGVGKSGIGAYHGQYSFETFSHRKSIYTKKMAFDVNVQYPPYTKQKLWWLKKLLWLT